MQYLFEAINALLEADEKEVKKAAIKERFEDKQSIIDWLSDHKVAFRDCIRFFKQKPNRDGEYTFSDVSREDLIGWIDNHDTLAKDFRKTFQDAIDESCNK